MTTSSSSRRPLTVVDLFCGAGGLSLGFSSARARPRFRVVLAVDANANACQTLRTNHPRTHVVCARVDARQVATLVEDCVPGNDAVDVIVGGPPCQPFSRARKRARNGNNEVSTANDDSPYDDPNNGVPAFIETIVRVQPRAFVMENVSALQQFLEDPLAALADSYDVYLRVLDAQDYGVPQHRERLFVVGVPPGAHFEWPEPTSQQRRRPVRSTLLLDDGNNTDGFGGDAMTEPVPAAIRYCRTPIVHGSPQTSYLVNGAGRPLRFDLPSPTITASASGAHAHIVDPDDVLADYYNDLLRRGVTAARRTGVVAGGRLRRLSLREMARIQSFPDRYAFFGSRTSKCRQIGNAVRSLACAPARLLHSLTHSLCSSHVYLQVAPLLARRVAEAVHNALTSIEAEQSKQNRS